MINIFNKNIIELYKQQKFKDKNQELLFFQKNIHHFLSLKIDSANISREKRYELYNQMVDYLNSSLCKEQYNIFLNIDDDFFKANKSLINFFNNIDISKLIFILENRTFIEDKNFKKQSLLKNYFVDLLKNDLHIKKLENLKISEIIVLLDNLQNELTYSYIDIKENKFNKNYFLLFEKLNIDEKNKLLNGADDNEIIKSKLLSISNTLKTQDIIYNINNNQFIEHNNLDCFNFLSLTQAIDLYLDNIIYNEDGFKTYLRLARKYNQSFEINYSKLLEITHINNTEKKFNKIKNLLLDDYLDFNNFINDFNHSINDNLMIKKHLFIDIFDIVINYIEKYNLIDKEKHLNFFNALLLNYICNEAYDVEKQKKILKIFNNSKEFNYFNNNNLKNDYKVILNKITSNEFNSQKTNTLFFKNLIYFIDFNFAKIILDLMKNDIIEKNDYFTTQIEKYLLEEELTINTENIKQSISKNKL